VELLPFFGCIRDDCKAQLFEPIGKLFGS